MKLKLGLHPLRINDVNAMAYPDTGASTTIVPKKFISKNVKCKNTITVLNGRSVNMQRASVNVEFMGMKKKLSVHVSPGSKDGVVWLGYPHLRAFGVDEVDIRNHKRNFKPSPTVKSCD